MSPGEWRWRPPQPIDIIAPMYDSIFRVVPVTYKSDTATPHNHGWSGRDRDNRKTDRLEISRQHEEDHDHRQARAPFAESLEHLQHGGHLTAHLRPAHAARQDRPPPSSASWMWDWSPVPDLHPSTFAVRLIYRIWLSRSYSSGIDAHADLRLMIVHQHFAFRSRRLHGDHRPLYRPNSTRASAALPTAPDSRCRSWDRPRRRAAHNGSTKSPRSSPLRRPLMAVTPANARTLAIDVRR